MSKEKYSMQGSLSCAAAKISCKFELLSAHIKSNDQNFAEAYLKSIKFSAK